MCLAIPAKILKITDNKALIESLGVKKEVEILLVPDAVRCCKRRLYYSPCWFCYSNN